MIYIYNLWNISNISFKKIYLIYNVFKILKNICSIKKYIYCIKKIFFIQNIKYKEYIIYKYI